MHTPLPGTLFSLHNGFLERNAYRARRASSRKAVHYYLQVKHAHRSTHVFARQLSLKYVLWGAGTDERGKSS